MSVDLSPASTLAFPRPLTTLVKRSLVVKNPNSESVAFKVKTTAPKQYCVRPNSGRIEPGESVEVSVLLQPMRADPPPGAKCKDKFLVQSAIIDASQEHLALAEIWSSIEAQGKERISEQKIRCAYVEPADADAGPTGAASSQAGAAAADETFDKSTLIDGSPNTHANGVSPDATQTQFHQADTTLPTSASTAAVAAGSPSPSSSPSTSAARSIPPAAAPSSSAGPTTTNVAPEGAAIHLAPALNASSLPPTTTTTTTSSTSPGGGLAPTTRTDGLPSSAAASTATTELDRLKDEIRRLKAQLAEQPTTAVAGLRKRGGGAGAVDEQLANQQTKTQKQQQQQQAVGAGVPVEVVAALCLGVFVMTYVFF